MSLPNIWYISMIMTEKHTNIITFEQEWTNFMKTKWGTKCFKPSACNLINCQIQDINCIDQCFKFQDGYLFSQLSQQQQHQQQHQQQQQQQQQQLLLLLLLLLILLQLLLLLLLLLKRQLQQSLEHQLQELSPQRQHIEDKEGTHLKPQHQINVLDK